VKQNDPPQFQTPIHENLHFEQVTCFCPQWVKPLYGRNQIVFFRYSAAERRSKSPIRFLRDSLHRRIYLGYGSITTSFSCTVDSRNTGHHGLIELSQHLLGPPESMHPKSVDGPGFERRRMASRTLFKTLKSPS
jgi:hypothetical protein